jgi:hypothetical protein
VLSEIIYNKHAIIPRYHISSVSYSPSGSLISIDVGIDAFIPEQAILAVILPEGADDSPECVAEAAAESGAFV